LEKRANTSREEHPVELRILPWYSNDLDNDDYYHFNKPKNPMIRKLFEWVGHHGADHKGESGIIGIKRNHVEWGLMSMDQYKEIMGTAERKYVDDFEVDADAAPSTLNATATPFVPGTAPGATRLNANASAFRPMSAAKSRPGSRPGSRPVALQDFLHGSLPRDLPGSRTPSRPKSKTGSKPKSGADSLQGSLPRNMSSRPKLPS
jgi:hypothetical protein